MSSTARPSTARPLRLRRIPPAAAFLLAVTAAAWWPSTVRATPEPTVRAALQDKQLQGQARLRVWGFEVYDASLWASPGFDAQRYEQHRFGLELSYLRSLKGRAIAERSIEEMRGIADISPEQATRWLAAMSELFPDVQRGDRITGVHVPGSGARFYLNDRLRGELADDAFSRLFFGIWLSPKTSQPAMRATLLQSVAAPRTP
ncbi:MAG: chalcone isomerase family protein [Hydrogenophaga sp.]|uniref:chalcone isomerase family protein n=1 Tax=Hydrogenophaga sp. TaxID=1904254 RepID=UPI00275EADAB|nr:chalcone isomerase family protein [Hydrogenophaga sp.]MDP2419529.1 chalcone isomerase family protein [Hydrogenophaga sp.]MDZ4188849.1 chalcone isomerase family protein [Hydrogenophaga sp.]